MTLNEIISDIKNKKELKGLDNKFIQTIASDNGDILAKFSKIDFKKLKRTREYKKFFKNIRKKLRLVYGISNELSFKERYPCYKEIYPKIFSITGFPKTILDLACGLNPLSYEFLGCKPFYYASELTEKDCIIIKNFFEKNNIKGSVFKFDLLNDDYKKLPESDVCFLFKVLEALEAVKLNLSREILQKIPAKYVIVSFAKVALGQKTKIKKKGRIWFRSMLKALGYPYDILDIGNEIFFVIKRKV
ncbi:MAG: hypothetical protein AB1571_01740 [Nanoarchaeota archaeon]